MNDFAPFGDDAAVRQIAGLAIENGTRAIVISGDLEITRDQAGLKKLQALVAVVTDIQSALSSDHGLPEAVPPSEAPAKVANPFS